MKSIKIEIPDGYEIDEENSTFSEIKFKPIKKGIQWEDFGVISGYWVSNFSRIESFKNGTSSSNWNNKNVWPTKEEAEACLALSQLCQWRDKYNEGWKPDWAIGDNKHIIHIWKTYISTATTCYSPTILSFKTESIRDKFLEDFRKLITIAKPLL